MTTSPRFKWKIAPALLPGYPCAETRCWEGAVTQLEVHFDGNEVLMPLCWAHAAKLVQVADEDPYTRSMNVN